MQVSDSPLLQADWQAIQTFEPGDPNENPWVQGRPGPELLEISAYDTAWPQTYLQLYRQITKTMKNRALAVEHIGATAVPYLPAKPVIDIDLIVAAPEDEASYIPALQALGYVLTVRERSWYGHRMLRLQSPRVNLHVFGPACPEHARHCLFRDWLREHEDDRQRYAEAKLTAGQGEHSVIAYNEKKQAVLRDVYSRLFTAGPRP